jgi:hypothetical protein
MLNISIDNELAARLRETDPAATVRDADGRLVGVFQCMSPEEAELYQLALDTVDREELARRADETRPGRSIQPLLERLRRMEQCGTRMPKKSSPHSGPWLTIDERSPMRLT